MLSKACIVGTYQRKLEAMVEQTPDLAFTVAVPPFWRDERGVSRLERVHTRGYRLEVLPMAFNGSFHMHYYPGLGTLLRRVKPDLVHIDEEPYNLATFHANVLARRSGARTLWFSWQNLQRWYPPPFSWFERYNLGRVDYALMGSQSAAEVWRAKGYRGPLAVVPQFGVDPEVFSPPVPSRPDSPVRIAYVGRLVPEKGVDLLLRALVGIEGAWSVTILGSGPDETALRETAVALGIEDRVTFSPWLASTAMPDFYRQTDILVLPSRSQSNWTEQFGRVLVEAMACEVAVVGSDVGEIPHVIAEAGLVFPEDDVAALRQHLVRLVGSAPERRRLGAAGRVRVLDRFTQRQVAAMTVDVYREVLA